MDVEIQKTVKGTYPDTEHVKFKTIPPVTVASATFQGPYRQIGEVNQAVASWVEDNGYAFDGLFFNIYHVSPHETRNPEKFVTEVCYPSAEAVSKQAALFQRRLSFLQRVPQIPSQASQAQSAGKMPMPRADRSRSVRYRAKAPTEQNTNSIAATSPNTCPVNAW